MAHTHLSLVYTSGATLRAVFQKTVSSRRKTAAGWGRSAKCLSQWSQQSPRTRRMENYSFLNLCDVLSDEADDNIHTGSHAFQSFWPYLGVRFHSTWRYPQMGERRDAETILLFKFNNKWGFNHEPIAGVSQTTFHFDEKASEGSYTSSKALFLGKYHHTLEWDYAERSEPELEKGWLSN